MAVYHQMGHDSYNLLAESELDRYAGAILSPVNSAPDHMKAQVRHIADTSPGLEMILDPQLYFPRSERGELPNWSYFPSQVDTADTASLEWWVAVSSDLVAAAEEIGVDVVCSPASSPRSFSADYFDLTVKVGSKFAEHCRQRGLRPLQTLLVGLSDLASVERVKEIASIASRTASEAIYLVLTGDTQPRREFSQSDELKGAMQLIDSLERSGLPVLVGYASTELVLWKAAGAWACATGKFFNLRRFTRSRFEEPADGGGQLPYWFEESLMAFLRESDLLRVQRAEGISEASQRNPFGPRILDRISSAPGSAWLALSWRQFLYAFADLEARIQAGQTDVAALLKDAEDLWRRLEDEDVLMEEPRNDGTWIRQWRRALVEFVRDRGRQA